MIPDPIIEIGNLKVHMYGVMIAVGILGTFIVLYLYNKKLGIDPKFTDFMYYNALVSIALGFGSAALFQAFYNFIEDPDSGFSFDGGITFIGGLIGGSLTFLIIYFIMRKKLTGRLKDVISMIPCCILIAHAFGRVGCFFAGCCYGKETECFLGVKFPELSGKVHPTQLYEAVFLFALFAICSYLVLKKNFRHNMSLYLIAYGIFRFFIEFVRDDDRGELIGFISPSQFWSILMVVLGVGLIFLMNKIVKAENSAAEAVAETADCEE